MSRDSYVSPLSGRYPSVAMKQVWSDNYKFGMWRELWIVLARMQKQLGLAITDEQIQQMITAKSPIDYDMAAKLEKELRHDVMAHIKTFGHAAPLAAPIIHLGATSCYVTDNTDLIQMKHGLHLLATSLVGAISQLVAFARKYKALPTLGFTHLQPAQPTTVGKRAAMWIQELLLVLEDLERLQATVRFRGVKGTTGTQASFLTLFQGDHEKVKMLDHLVTKEFGFSKAFVITGQTYTRQQDIQVLEVLSRFGAAAHYICVTIRLLQTMKEIEEPFEKSQVGSTAMAYKRNPMRCERACSLARELMEKSTSARNTLATQMFERTLDDSAGRRMYLAESFLLADAICLILQNVFEGLVVYPKVIERHLAEELPFMATEEIIAAMVAKGGDRQECHERLRQHSQAAGNRVKQEGLSNDLFDRLMKDDYFDPVHNYLFDIVDATVFIGRAPQQVDEFIDGEVLPVISKYPDIARADKKTELTV